MTNDRPSLVQPSSPRPNLRTLAALALALTIAGLAPSGCGIGIGGLLISLAMNWYNRRVALVER